MPCPHGLFLSLVMNGTLVSLGGTQWDICTKTTIHLNAIVSIFEFRTNSLYQYFSHFVGDLMAIGVITVI